MIFTRDDGCQSVHQHKSSK